MCLHLIETFLYYLIGTAVLIEMLIKGMSRVSKVIWSHHYKNVILVPSNRRLSVLP